MLPEEAIAVGFAAACGIVLVAIAAVLARAAISVRQLRRRMKALVPLSLRSQVKSARADVRRASAALAALQPLAARAAMSLISIGRSLAALRAYAAGFRRLLGL